MSLVLLLLLLQCDVTVGMESNVCKGVQWTKIHQHRPTVRPSDVIPNKPMRILSNLLFIQKARTKLWHTVYFIWHHSVCVPVLFNGFAHSKPTKVDSREKKPIKIVQRCWRNAHVQTKFYAKQTNMQFENKFAKMTKWFTWKWFDAEKRCAWHFKERRFI